MFGLSPLTPAYGRDYKSMKALKADFDADMDFSTPSGSYTNKSDLLSSDISQIQVRYNSIRNIGMLKISGPIVPIVEKEDSSVGKPFKGISIGRYQKLDAGLDCVGYCVSCSKMHKYIEDDLEDGNCSKCGENSVQGIGTLLMMGLVN